MFYKITTKRLHMNLKSSKNMHQNNFQGQKSFTEQQYQATRSIRNPNQAIINNNFDNAPKKEKISNNSDYQKQIMQMFGNNNPKSKPQTMPMTMENVNLNGAQNSRTRKEGPKEMAAKQQKIQMYPQMVPNFNPMYPQMVPNFNPMYPQMVPNFNPGFPVMPQMDPSQQQVAQQTTLNQTETTQEPIQPEQINQPKQIQELAGVSQPEVVQEESIQEFAPIYEQQPQVVSQTQTNEKETKSNKQVKPAQKHLVSGALNDEIEKSIQDAVQVALKKDSTGTPKTGTPKENEGTKSNN
jgi:hypothetical protein